MRQQVILSFEVKLNLNFHRPLLAAFSPPKITFDNKGLRFFVFLEILHFVQNDIQFVQNAKREGVTKKEGMTKRDCHSE